MAKALFGIALWLLITFSVLAASPPKKQPGWAELSQDQQQILAPLQPRWDGMNAQRRSMWLGIARKYPSMTPVDQEKVQRRMRAWVGLSQEERRTVRENFKKIQRLPPDKKQTLKQEWDEYNKLSEEERRKLGARTAKTPARAARKPKPAAQPVPPAAPPVEPPAAVAPQETPAASN